MPSLELKKFDMKRIQFQANDASDPKIILIGRRETGISMLIKDVQHVQQENENKKKTGK
jgi:hypothetical protein